MPTLAILSLVLPSGPNSSLLSALALPFLMPIGYLFLILPLALLLSVLQWIPFVGLVSLVLALTIALGDPFVCLLKKIYPSAVPVDDPTFFSLTPVFWLLEARETSIAS